MMEHTIGISLGDVTGIGPEVTLKALAQAPENARFLLIGDEGRIRRVHNQLGLTYPIRQRNEAPEGCRCFIHDPGAEPLPENLSPGAPPAARAAVSWLREAAQLCLRNQLDAMVTAPVSKEAIIRSGQSFIGQTEYLSDLAGTHRTIMMLLGKDDRGRWLRVALATTHFPIRNVASQITQAKVELAIELAANACRDLGLERARVAVCGLNPHAGEGGKLGDEEQTTIGPAVQAMRQKGADVVGPFSADTLFRNVYRGDYEAVVAMYHDQGLAPLKMVAFDTGVNWTLGLPFIRTSPDHGTAYDIAGRGCAESSSMSAAIELAVQLAAVRRARKQH